MNTTYIILLIIYFIGIPFAYGFSFFHWQVNWPILAIKDRRLTVVISLFFMLYSWALPLIALINKKDYKWGLMFRFHTQEKLVKYHRSN